MSRAVALLCIFAATTLANGSLMLVQLRATGEPGATAPDREMPSVESVLAKLTEAQKAFEAEAREMEKRVTHIQREQKDALSGKKAKYEKVLAEQSRANTDIFAANQAVREEITTIGKANKVITNEIQGWHEGNRILRDALQSLGPKVRTAQEFTSESLFLTDDSQAQALEVLRRQPPPSLDDFLKMARSDIDAETKTVSLMQATQPVNTSALRLSSSDEAKSSAATAHGDHLVAALAESLDELSDASAEGELQLEARFIALRERYEKENADLVSEQAALNKTKAELLEFQAGLDRVRKQVKGTGRRLSDRLEGLVTFAQHVEIALNQTLTQYGPSTVVATPAPASPITSNALRSPGHSRPAVSVEAESEDELRRQIQALQQKLQKFQSSKKTDHTQQDMKEQSVQGRQGAKQNEDMLDLHEKTGRTGSSTERKQQTQQHLNESESDWKKLVDGKESKEKDFDSGKKIHEEGADASDGKETIQKDDGDQKKHKEGADASDGKGSIQKDVDGDQKKHKEGDDASNGKESIQKDADGDQQKHKEGDAASDGKESLGKDVDMDQKTHKEDDDASIRERKEDEERRRQDKVKRSQEILEMRLKRDAKTVADVGEKAKEDAKEVKEVKKDEDPDKENEVKYEDKDKEKKDKSDYYEEDKEKQRKQGREQKEEQKQQDEPRQETNAEKDIQHTGENDYSANHGGKHAEQVQEVERDRKSRDDDTKADEFHEENKDAHAKVEDSGKQPNNELKDLADKNGEEQKNAEPQNQTVEVLDLSKASSLLAELMQKDVHAETDAVREKGEARGKLGDHKKVVPAPMATPEVEDDSGALRRQVEELRFMVDKMIADKEAREKEGPVVLMQQPKKNTAKAAHRPKQAPLIAAPANTTGGWWSFFGLR